MTLSCSAIDTALQITTDGGIKPCCPGAHELGNLRNNSIDIILSGDTYKQVRQSIVNGTSPYCKNCDINDSVIPNSSQRHTFNRAFPSPGYQQLKQLDIRWSNLCNLACRYCCSNDSSEWAKLESKPIESISRDYAQGVLDLIKQNRNTIQVVYLLGGEPLLQKYNEDLLDILDNKTQIDIVTNLNVRLDNNRVYEKLKSFPHVRWNVSVDNVGDRFEYVRHGASWDLLLDNIDTLKQDFGQAHIFLHPVYSIWSAFSLAEYLDFTQRLGVEVWWQLANEDEQFPDLIRGFNIFKHSNKIKESASKQIDQLGRVDYRSKKFLGQVRDGLLATTSVLGRAEKFLSWTAQNEQQLKPKYPFKDLWSELNTLLVEDLQHEQLGRLR